MRVRPVVLDHQRQRRLLVAPVPGTDTGKLPEPGLASVSRDHQPCGQALSAFESERGVVRTALQCRDFAGREAIGAGQLDEGLAQPALEEPPLEPVAERLAVRRSVIGDAASARRLGHLRAPDGGTVGGQIGPDAEVLGDPHAAGQQGQHAPVGRPGAQSFERSTLDQPDLEAEPRQGGPGKKPGMAAADDRNVVHPLSSEPQRRAAVRPAGP